ncbi:MAG: beta-aspartyl-peptidase [Acetivibrionales bacterium]|jgi:beta-aspartyl-dipeptidase (metallo-type)
MFILLKGGECYSPEYLGKKDILIVSGKVYRVEDNIPGTIFEDLQIIDCKGCIVCPGFIDQHVHIAGGGGEQGPLSKTPGLGVMDIIGAGVCTVVGILGTDDITRSMAELLAKARALEQEGITSYIYTGCYSIPPATLTGSVKKDIAYIDKVIGLGEIAIADHRSSHPTLQDLKELSAEVRVGGLIGGKPGILHLHVGEGKEGISLLFKLLEESDFPAGMFVPTHLNRNKALFNQALEYCKAGGNIDLTAGERSEKGYSIPDALGIIFSRDLDYRKVTVSSDGNGSVPEGSDYSDSAGKVLQLFKDIRSCIVDKKLDVKKVLCTVTSNVAGLLDIYPRKGAVKAGSDADILVLDSGFNIKMVIAGGRVLINNKPDG